jgi:hypothetical protein
VARSRVVPEFLKRLAPGVKISFKETPPAKNDKPKLPRVFHDSGGKSFIERVLIEQKIDYVKELKFDTNRRFRFDFAVPSIMVAIEYEGLTGSKTKGGHQTKKGFSSNTDKYNLATIAGWKVLRYTYSNYKDFSQHILKYIKPCTETL